MKAITHIKHPSQYTQVPCAFCNKLKYINKHYLKKIGKNFNQYCDEQCKNQHIDPKQFKILNHIHTPNFCYLIGLIATDGHIGYPGCTKSTKTYYCNIKLKNNTHETTLLKKIQTIFGGTINIENNKTIVWRVGNKDFVKYLIKIGFTHNKTNNLDIEDYFNSLTEINKKHFLRGVIDGDGCVAIRDRSNKTRDFLQCSFNICSASPKFINIIEKYFNGTLYERTKEKNKYATQSLYYYWIYGKHILKEVGPVFNTIESNMLYLERKYLKYKLIEQYYSTINQ